MSCQLSGLFFRNNKSLGYPMSSLWLQPKGILHLLDIDFPKFSTNIGTSLRPKNSRSRRGI